MLCDPENFRQRAKDEVTCARDQESPNGNRSVETKTGAVTKPGIKTNQQSRKAQYGTEACDSIQNALEPRPKRTHPYLLRLMRRFG